MILILICMILDNHYKLCTTTKQPSTTKRYRAFNLAMLLCRFKFHVDFLQLLGMCVLALNDQQYNFPVHCLRIILYKVCGTISPLFILACDPLGLKILYQIIRA
jgi:hypothetical protein